MTRTNLRAIRKIRITLLLELLAAAVFLLICYGPIAGMVIGAFNTDPVSLDHLISGRRITLLFNSLLFSALVAVAASLVGFLCASLVFQRGSKISKVLIWLPLVYLALPTYIHALSWTGLLQQINSWLINMRFEPFHLSGWGLAGWVQMLSLFPIAYGIHLVALQTLDSQVVDAARCYASEAKVFRQVILPLTKPFWVVSLVVLFLFSLADYSIPYLYAVNVYALEIFTEFSASAQYGNALITALPLLLCSFLLILWVFLKIRRISLQLGAKSMQQPLLSIWPSWIRVLQKGAFVVLVFQLLVPVP